MDDAKMVDVTITIQELPSLSRKQFKLKKAFQSAKSVEQSLKAFKRMEMESSFHESDFGLPCWNLAELLLGEGRHEEALVFGKRSLQILLANMNNDTPCFGNYSPGILTCNDDKGVRRTCSVIHNTSLFIASVCNVLGTACVKLRRYDEGLSYLNWADRNLSNLEQDSEEIGCNGKCVMNALVVTHFQLCRVKVFTHRYDEVVCNLRKILEVKEHMLEEGCIELGAANLDVCNSYTLCMDFNHALPYCLKALEIQTKHLGSDSVEVAQTRKRLGWIYNELQEYEKESEQNELAESVLKEMTTDSPDSPDSLIEAGRYDEAVGVLKDVVSRDDIEEDRRASAYVSMAEAFYKLGKFRYAKKHLRTAQRILEKEGLNQIYVAILFLSMSKLYKKLGDCEAALSLIRRVVAIPELPPNLLSKGALTLISLIPQEKEEIPYMLNLVEKLKASIGPEHIEVGYSYAHLGVVYWNSGQQEVAVKFLADAKDIMDDTIGPNHTNSLNTSQILATSYAKMGRFDLAIEIQQKVVEGFKALGPSEQEFLEKAVVYLDKMTEEISESPSSSSPQVEDDGADLSTMISMCGISDDETEIK